MASKLKQVKKANQRKLSRDFMYWALAAFIIKLIVIVLS